MRTLEINKSRLWLVNITGDVKVYDEEDLFTGEITKGYSEPVVIKLAVYPATGQVLEQTFGKDATLDLIAVTTDVELTKDSLLFLSAPSEGADYYTKYDYRVESILPSLNSTVYGLRRRT